MIVVTQPAPSGLGSVPSLMGGTSAGAEAVVLMSRVHSRCSEFPGSLREGLMLLPRGEEAAPRSRAWETEPLVGPHRERSLRKGLCVAGRGDCVQVRSVGGSLN